MAVSRALSLVLQRYAMGHRKRVYYRVPTETVVKILRSAWSRGQRLAVLIVLRRQRLNAVRMRAAELAARQRPRAAARRFGIHPILRMRGVSGQFHTLVQTLRQYPDKFYNYFRMTVPMFDDLVNLMEERLTRSAHNAIPPAEKLAMTLRYLASGDMMKSMAYNYLLGGSTVSKLIREVCRAVWETLHPIVFEPLNEQTWRNVAAEFGATWQFDNCCGAMDGKHIVCQAFPHCGSAYYNYKGQNSIVLLAIANARYEFLMVDVGGRGRRCDGGILKSSNFGRNLVQGQVNLPAPQKPPGYNKKLPFVFIGDGAFPLRPDFLRPFPGSFLPPEEVIFNYRLSRARRVIENAFGILSARWRIFRRIILASEETLQAIVLACCALHNLHCRDNRERYIPREFVRQYADGALQDMPPDDPGAEEGEDVDDGDEATLKGRRVAFRFMEYFIDRPVPWQWKKVVVEEETPHQDE